MPGVPARFKTSSCTKCKESITDDQFEQCLGLCEVCHKAYFEELIGDEESPEIRDRLKADLEDAQREYDAEDESFVGSPFDIEDQDLLGDR